MYKRVNFSAILIVALLWGCNKSDRDKDTSVTMVESYAYAELVSNDIFNTVYQIIHSESSLYKTSSTVLPACANLTIDTLVSPFKIKIDYGSTDCADANGYLKKGVIQILQNGKFKSVGSTLTITFDKYQFQDKLITGSLTVKYTNKDGANRKVMQLTFKDGNIKYPADAIYFNCARTYIQTKGDTTKTFTDDEWVIKGNFSGIGIKGEPFNVVIDSVLTGNPTCNYPTGGLSTLTPGGKLTKRSLDFGNGDCKKTLTVKFNGLTKTIDLK